MFVLLVVLFPTMMLTSSSTVTYDLTMPNRMNALRGSCVQIPCTFNVSDFEAKLIASQEIVGSWLKNKHSDPSNDWIFKSSNTIKGGFNHIEMPKNLSLRECTVVFYNVTNSYTDVYYFRLEMDQNIFYATFVNSFANITVMDVPNPPELSDVQEVIEGTAVNLTCSAEAPCPKHPPALSWSNISSSPNITTWIEETPNKTQSVVSKMSFIASYINHRQNISCIVTYPRNFSNATTAESSKMIQVLFAPKETRILTNPSTSVSVGTNVTLTCKSKANPSNGMNFTWFKRGKQEHMGSGEQLTLIVCRSDEGWYSCRAKNKHGNQTSEEIQLIVKDVSNPPELNGVQEVIEGTAFNLICSAEVFCSKEPPTISWSNYPKYANITPQLQKEINKTQSVVSNMSFIASYMDHRQNVSCTVTYSGNLNATTVESSKMIQVLFAPKDTHILTEPSTSVSVGTNVTLTCKSKANPSNGMNFTWFKRGKQEHLVSGEQLTLNVCRSDEGWYSCRAKNKHGNQTSEEIQLIVKESLQSSVMLIAGCAGGVVAFLLLLFILAVIFTRCRKQRTQAANEPFVGEVDILDLDQKTQVLSNAYTNTAFVSNKQPEKSNHESDGIHYGEINFSTIQTKPTTDEPSAHEGQETVYSEVCNKKKFQD